MTSSLVICVVCCWVVCAWYVVASMLRSREFLADLPDCARLGGAVILACAAFSPVLVVLQMLNALFAARG